MILSSNEMLFVLCLFLTARNEFPGDKILPEMMTAFFSKKKGQMIPKAFGILKNIIISWDTHINCTV